MASLLCCYEQVLCGLGVVTKRSHITEGDGLPFSCWCEQVLCDLSVATKRPHITEGDGLPSLLQFCEQVLCDPSVATTRSHVTEGDGLPSSFIVLRAGSLLPRCRDETVAQHRVRWHPVLCFL